MHKDTKPKLPFILPDSFHDWDNVSVARVLLYTSVQSIAQHLDSRDNYDPEFTTDEIGKFQHFLYNDCLTPDEKSRITYEEFVDQRTKTSSSENEVVV